MNVMKGFNIESGRGGIGARGVMEGQNSFFFFSSPFPKHSRWNPLQISFSSGSSPPRLTLKKTQELKLKVEYGESPCQEFMVYTTHLLLLHNIIYQTVYTIRCGGVSLLLPVKSPNPIFVFFFSFTSPLTCRFLQQLPLVLVTSDTAHPS